MELDRQKRRTFIEWVWYIFQLSYLILFVKIIANFFYTDECVNWGPKYSVLWSSSQWKAFYYGFRANVSVTAEKNVVVLQFNRSCCYNFSYLCFRDPAASTVLKSCISVSEVYQEILTFAQRTYTCDSFVNACSSL